MATYISLINWTDKGIANVKDAPARMDAAQALARQMGGEMKQIFLTMGGYDLVAIIEMPNDEAAAQYALRSAAGGSIRTTTLRAFDEATCRKIVGSL
jgi:uncharacterized protein with GYD domain